MLFLPPLPEGAVVSLLLPSAFLVSEAEASASLSLSACESEGSETFPPMVLFFTASVTSSGTSGESDGQSDGWSG